MSSSGDQKTEQATPRRRQKARDEGRVAQSRDIPSAAAFLAGLSVLWSTREAWVSSWSSTWQATCVDLAHPAVPWRTLAVFPCLLGLVLAASTGAALLIGWGQTGFLYSPKAMSVDMSRLDPFSGLGKLVSGKAWMETLKTVLKAGIILAVAWVFLKDFARDASGWGGVSAFELYSKMTSEGFRLAWRCSIVLIVLAAADYIYQRQIFEMDLMMTRREAKEEVKESEGNPQIKSRIRALMRRIATRRMMSKVPKADVVVTNPTHFAVALQYSNKMSAPQVVAKGADLIAKKIREIASANGVPIVENKPLARILYQKVDIGRSVPVELYQAVAEVLAYVYRLKKKSPWSS
jgi:flagellar biosynthetic protein FlhB